MDEPDPSSSRYAPYRYVPLKPEEIRLAELLPGARENDICLIIRHARLATDTEREHAPPTITKHQIQETLPADWIVRQTLEGRFIFERVREYGLTESFETSWTHPVTLTEPEWQNFDVPPSELAYEALSYVWGQGGTITAFIETCEGLQTLRIRKNLANVLRELRYPATPRTLWIDAVCIDQSNISERAQQVKAMGDIYRLAYRVVIWLGPESDDSGLAMSRLAYIGQQLERVEGGTWKVNPPGCDQPTWFRSSVDLPYDDVTWQAISGLLRRPWFERVWVVQEARLGNSRSLVRCGDEEMPLALFNRAIRCVSNKSVMSEDLRALLQNAEETTSPISSEPFLFVLQMVGQKRCSDAQDKIYGALGLAPLQFSRRLRIDYNLAVADVYRDMYTLYLHQARRTDFLLQCQLTEGHAQGPTWVPGWSKLRIASSLHISFEASGISMFDGRVVDGRVLELSGVRCGVIDFVANEAPDSVNGKLSALREWRPEDSLTRTYVTGESLMDAFVKTISMLRLRERYPITRAYPTLKSARFILEEALNLNHDNEEEIQLKPPLESQVLRLLKYQQGRFIRTSDGYFGLTTAAAAAGDIVCCLLGCPSPIILRPTASNEFLVVGCAFIYGVMDAEVLLGPLPNGWCVEKLFSDQFRRRQTRFRNCSTGAISSEDPRLESFPLEWEAFEITKDSAVPINSAHFRHKETGDTINGDPRLLPSALRERGVILEKFSLV